MIMSNAWYFAYGSNMQRATFAGRRGIAFSRALPARVNAWRLVFDKPPLLPIGESYANIIPDPAAEVLGVLYEVTLDDLAHIDFTEGVQLGNYRRVEVPAIPLAPIEPPPLSAFTLTSERRDDQLQPSLRYMSLLIAGAIEHRLPADYVEFLRSVPARPETPEAIEFRAMVDDVLRRR
ncbi:MAG TPA: gamma-glutamylcyclotransferase family protein [Candidatus Binatia bacterium]|nr:gamma-glutamylcyclotransferase family protein [Candidatus Binatia bacterium]